MRILKQLGLVGMTFALTLAGCAKDRSVDDYQREKLEKELAKIEAVSGEYRGQLEATGAKGARGALEVVVTPDIQQGASSDASAVISGKIVLDDVPIEFTAGTLNTSSGDVKATVKLAEATVDLSGRISGDVFTGSLKTQGNEEFGGRFRIIRNGAKGTRLEGAGAGDLRGLLVAINYRAEVVFSDGGKDFVFLTIDRATQDRDQEFVSRLHPVGVVDGQIRLGGRGIAFTGAKVDIRTRILTGRSAQGAELRCRALGTGADAWDCAFSPPAGASWTGVFVKVANNE